ncbi:MAG: SUMF1/EgtB/PvdO family nonheme iron enzyme, partial [Dechloromonas sp.]|nr:SUMF1/EgtB/PvdO family nonheme iron enzyme [Candidatus Dechloromonas phosphorivorans]
IRRLNAKTGNSYRLPSEAEWEYACRTGSRDEYCGGNNLDAVGWYGALAHPVGNSAKTTNPVARKQSNAWGLYDMSGNVGEWTQDCWNESYSGNGAPNDGSVRTDGDCSKRVVRGGSWIDAPWFERSASRIKLSPPYRSGSVGFRLARTLSP